MRIKLDLTECEYDQIMLAISQMTGGNAYDIDEMMMCGMTRPQAAALLRAEEKLRNARRRRTKLVDPAGLEPATYGLQNRCSTAELRWRSAEECSAFCGWVQVRGAGC